MEAAAAAAENTFLNCPFAEKNEAKKLGAKWDGEKKRWFVPAGTPLEPFRRWLPNSGRCSWGKLS